MNDAPQRVPSTNSADRLMPDALYDDLREYLEGQVDVDGQGGPNKASRFLDRLEAECRKQKGGSMIDRSDERLNPNDYR